VNWIPGRSPELSIFDDEELLEKLDVSGYTTAQLHDLLASKGFGKKSAEVDGEQAEL
jgi:hypothetical protein